MKRILIITTSLTGMGHKSASDSIEGELSSYKDLYVKTIEGFELGSEWYKAQSQIYSKSVKLSYDLWHFLWVTSDIGYKEINMYISKKIEKKFLATVKEVKPDLILTVQPMFVGSILNIMEHYYMDIPFGVCITDIVSISNFWTDKRANFVICPTEECKEACLVRGVDEKRIQSLSYPLRPQFLKVLDKSMDFRIQFMKRCELKNQVNILMVAGGDGTANFYDICDKIRKKLSHKYKFSITIVTGRNMVLKAELEKKFKVWGKDKRFYITVKGFVKNMEHEYMNNNIGILRASPGVMMEGVACRLPMIFFDYIPGQESGNGEFAQKNGIGTLCSSSEEIINKIENYIGEDFKVMKDMIYRQNEFYHKYLNKPLGKYLYDFINNKTTL
ncbi:processive 1,2-diacylglycerol beta-glucosyltransferase [Hathewaya proteolytica DSM 3090]|uniref:Processive 1,2-diacylglycerol beta-glucosyltransferase n=1 Tax=Hathewaya proteolytica DSM 3090 TaxID=1121331 RepID=A0A1M6N6V3_9CLOT|nr:hypothetical protein [Hathewaya proteolytica]SHJ91430.1 processive 1,2-diacylglycerol beta-glucosyltransferase [Hathewaya proteolytica DSM 3090]